MKNILILLIFIYCNLTFSQSQRELNENAKQEYTASDNRLDFIYKHLQKEYTKDTTFVKNLKNSQRIWIKFRLAELDLKYPNERNNYYGNTYPMCKWIYLKDLTNSRIDKLSEWIIGTEEGDVCKGSIKTKDKSQ